MSDIEDKKQTETQERESAGALPSRQYTSRNFNPHLLRHLREHVAEISHEELGDAIDVDLEKIQHWETGRRIPSQKHQEALEKYFGISSGSLALEMREVMTQDFNTAYFGDEAARERLEWVNKNRKLGKALRIIPS